MIHHKELRQVSDLMGTVVDFFLDERLLILVGTTRLEDSVSELVTVADVLKEDDYAAFLHLSLTGLI